MIAGHQHNYERTFPVFQRVPVSYNYTDPQAPVYLVSGTAGVRITL